MDANLTDQAEQLATEIAMQAKTLDDLNGLMKLMMKSALERMLDTELDVHLGRKRLPGSTANSPAQIAASSVANAPTKKGARNRRNGHSQKTVQGDLGEIKLTTPRDRDGTFEPQLIPKHQRRLAGFDEKILALYAKGMTTRDIQEIVNELYGVDVSPTLISEITADLDAQVTAWRTRQLDAVWPIIYFDGIVVHVRGASGRVLPQTMYVALGVNMQGRKELLGLWLNETEGAKFWLSCLTDLKTHGLKDIFIACIDGLSGFAEALLRRSRRRRCNCVSCTWCGRAQVCRGQGQRRGHSRPEEDLPSGDGRRSRRGPRQFCSSVGRQISDHRQAVALKWPDIAAMFDFPPEIRKAIYTTNAIESVNSVIRKFTRNRKQYPNEESALKLVYLAIHEASKKWTLPIRNWRGALNHFAIIFENRLPAPARG